MAVQVRIELNTEGIKRFLQTDEGIGKDLKSRADRVKDSADAKIPDPPRSADEHHTASVWVGHDRQRASVRTTSIEAKKAEAHDHTLLSSVDAARST